MKTIVLSGGKGLLETLAGELKAHTKLRVFWLDSSSNLITNLHETASITLKNDNGPEDDLAYLYSMDSEKEYYDATHLSFDDYDLVALDYRYEQTLAQILSALAHLDIYLDNNFGYVTPIRRVDFPKLVDSHS